MAENIDIPDCFVVDASFVLAFLLSDEKAAKVDKVFINYQQGKVKLVSSTILGFEVLNALRAAVLTKRITQNLSLKLAQNFLDLHIDLQEPILKEIFLIAFKYGVSVYDAAYIHLSKNRHLPLLSLDKSIQKALLA